MALAIGRAVATSGEHLPRGLGAWTALPKWQYMSRLVEHLKRQSGKFYCAFI